MNNEFVVEIMNYELYYSILNFEHHYDNFEISNHDSILVAYEVTWGTLPLDMNSALSFMICLCMALKIEVHKWLNRNH